MPNSIQLFNDSKGSADEIYKRRLDALQFNVSMSAKNNLPINVSEIREELVAILTHDGETKVASGLEDTTVQFKSKDMTKLVGDIPYLSLKDILIYIPRGMNGTYVEAGIALNAISGEIARIDEEVLTPLVNYTAKLVERPEELERPFPYKQTVDIAAIIRQLNEAFAIPSEKVQATYSTVIKRNRDWSDAAKLNEDLQSVLTEERLKVLMEKHDRVRSLSKLLDRTLEESNADLTASAKTIEAYIEYVDYTAKLLSLYGHVNSAALAYNVALNDNITRLKEILS